jgi:hypothetical protein
MKITLFLFFILLASSAFAQSGYEHLAVNAHGMGRTYVVSAKGLDAVGLNPARLYDKYSKQFEVRLFPLASYGIDAGPSFRDPDATAQIFNVLSDTITDPERKAAIEALEDQKLSGRSDLSVLGAAYSTDNIGTFAFTWSTHAAVRTDIPQDFLDFLYRAEAIVAQTGGFYSDLDVQALWYNDFAISYGNRFYENRNDSSAFFQFFDAGTSIKLIGGVASYWLQPGNYFHVYEPFGGTPIQVNYKILSSYSNDFDPNNLPNRLSFAFLTPSNAGDGFGLDFGAYAGFMPSKLKRPTLLIGASITDIGSITWTNKAQVRAVYNDSQFFAFQGTVKDLNDSLKAFEGDLHDTSSYSTPLPTVFRFGSSLDIGAMGKRWFGFYPTLAMEYSVGLSETVGSFMNNRLGLGLGMNRQLGQHEVRFGTGIAFQKNLTDVTLGLGATLANTVAIDVATSHFTDLFKSSATLDIAFSIKAQFNL